MDTLQYSEINAAITCGEYDCLKGCCSAGQLAAVARLLRNKTDSDIALIEKMLCGCAIPKGLTQAP